MLCNNSSFKPGDYFGIWYHTRWTMSYMTPALRIIPVHSTPGCKKKEINDNPHIKLLIGWTRYQRTYRYITSTSGMKGLQWFCRGCTSHKWLNCTRAPCVFVITEQIFCVQNWFVNKFLTIPFKLSEINPIQANKLLAQPSVCPWLNKQELEHWISLCALHERACVFVCVRSEMHLLLSCEEVSCWKNFFHLQRPSAGVKEISFSFAGNVTLRRAEHKHCGTVMLNGQFTQDAKDVLSGTWMYILLKKESLKTVKSAHYRPYSHSIFKVKQHIWEPVGIKPPTG